MNVSGALGSATGTSSRGGPSANVGTASSCRMARTEILIDKLRVCTLHEFLRSAAHLVGCNILNSLKPRKVGSAPLKKRRERLARLGRLQPLTEFLALEEHARLDRCNPSMLHQAFGCAHGGGRQGYQVLRLEPRMPDYCIGRQNRTHEAHLECLVGSKWFT